MSHYKKIVKKLVGTTGIVLLAAVVLMVNMTSAFGENTPEEKVLGVGRIQSDPNAPPIATTQKLVLPATDPSATGLSAAELATPISRAVVINQLPPAPPGSTYNLTAGNPSPDSDYGEWKTGLASAYGIGNVGYTTHWGNMLTWDSMGVAVPIGMKHLMGSYVEIEYGGKSITCFIDDTGGFAIYGRVLDLQPGVWKYFGFEHEDDWGVRNVRYRIITKP